MNLTRDRATPGPAPGESQDSFPKARSYARPCISERHNPLSETTSPKTTGSRNPGQRRPHRNLLVYFALCSLVFGPFFLFYLLPQTFRFRTLRYSFDDEGVTMRWGVLFRKEISLTYPRIQDIHLTSNLVERWLGLARVQVQTAAGSSKAEMTVEGLRDFEEIRDFLYSRMQGAKAEPEEDHGPAPAASEDAVTAALLEAAGELRALRRVLERAPAKGQQPS